MSPTRWFVGAWLLSLSTGCLTSLEPEVGALLSVQACAGEDSDPSQDVSFEQDVFPLISRARAEGGCLDCHSEDGTDRSGLNRTGLDLSTYGRLRAGSETFGPDIVLAGDPCGSPLYIKLTPAASEPRMPKDGPYWAPAELRLIHDWIAEGAQNN